MVLQFFSLRHVILWKPKAWLSTEKPLSNFKERLRPRWTHQQVLITLYSAAKTSQNLQALLP